MPKGVAKTVTQKKNDVSLKIEKIDEQINKLLERLDSMKDKKSKLEENLSKLKLEENQQNITGFKTKKWKSAINWLDKNKDEYFTIVAIRHIPNAKSSESQYEYAIYEESNRTEGYCIRGIVGTDLYSNNSANVDTKKELCNLFPLKTKDKSQFNILYKKYLDDVKDDNYSDNYAQYIYDAIKYLFLKNGFYIVY